MGVDVPCKLTAGSIVSVSDTFSVFAFMTMVSYFIQKRKGKLVIRGLSVPERAYKEAGEGFLQGHRTGGKSSNIKRAELD